MNRQLRRAQAKLDQKAEKEKQLKRDARAEKVQQLKAQRKQRRERIVEKNSEQKEKKKAPPIKFDGPPSKELLKKLPGRFSGALMIASIFFIVINSAVPVEEEGVLASITGGGFYLLYGYFSVLFLSRRGMPNGFVLTVITGLILVAGMIAGRFFIPELPHDWLMMGIAAPGVVLGAYLGKLVWDTGTTNLK